MLICGLEHMAAHFLHYLPGHREGAEAPTVAPVPLPGYRGDGLRLSLATPAVGIPSLPLPCAYSRSTLSPSREKSSDPMTAALNSSENKALTMASFSG